MKQSEKIAIIGGGNLGQAIADGLLKSKQVDSSELVITRRNIKPLTHFSASGVQVTSDNAAAVAGCRIIILAVKPYQVEEVISGIRDVLCDRHILISVVTGVSLSALQEMLAAKNIALYRAMPNTAIAVQQSMTCISKNSQAQEDDLVSAVFNPLGKIVWIEDALMDAATVLAACGTAYAMRYIRANIQGGIEIGFDAQTAALIAAQTVKGAAELLLSRNTHPEQEIDKVTTPKGCTIAGLNEMEHCGFSSSLIRGVLASFRKIGT